MLRRTLALSVLLLPVMLLPGLTPGARAAGPAHAHAVLDYDAYAAGVPVMRMRVELDLTTSGYAVRAAYHTTGLVNVLVSSEQVATVDGTWRGDGVAPQDFRSDGRFRGSPRHVLISYAGGQPQVRTLVPPNDEEREAIPPAMQANTEDTLSAMAELVHQVGAGRGCAGRAITFDGRRVVEIAVRDAGQEALPPTGRSSFAGPTLRCDFDGRQLAGFLRDAGDGARAPKRGSAWFAPAMPGGPSVPVRIAFQTPWVGMVTMYLVRPDPGASGG